MLSKFIVKREKVANAQFNERQIERNHQKNKEDFDSIMSFSKSVLDQTKELDLGKGVEHPIVDVVRLVGRGIQTHYLTNLLYVKYESGLPNLYPEGVLFNFRSILSQDGRRFEDLIKESKLEKTILLNRDLVLPWPWKTSRLVNCIAQIGEGRVNNPWRQDVNHSVDLWLPMGIAWVHSGNHSISAGLIQGKGSIKPNAVYDISEVYDYVQCDGFNYYRKEDGSIISSVKNAEIAAIFEIGRLMKENSISF
ncbi:DUF6710 family protein [Sporosarcina gallistercoris]|uniref:DUF6710 family protein n=1 Tax=Sporosarcina gallistercoris TaxID=2762245 RepID=UPI003D2DA7C2